MYKYKSEFLKFIEDRGFLNQVSDPENLDKTFLNKNVTAYIGFDCTAPSLHIGSLIQIMLLRHLQNFGHNPIILVGGGTSKVGDPSLKDKSRSLLSKEDINKNLKGIKKTFGRFIDLKKEGTKIVNNNDWLGELNYIDFLRNVGTNFSVNRMLSFDSVKLRLEREQPLSFLEFNYMVMQGYDFYELNKRYDCILQMGGSDQWGNIVCGIDLGRRLSGASLFGLTTPLLTTSTGKKMGKTEQGAVWIDQNKYSSYDFYQYWRNVDDNDVEKLLLIFSDLDKEEIKILIKEDINNAKKKLAYFVTTDCHSESSAQEAEKKARSIFENNSYDNIDEINFKIDSKLIDTLTSNSTVSSKSEAKRLIEGGGIKIDDDQINDINLTIDKSYNEKILKIGKKKYFKIIVK